MLKKFSIIFLLFLYVFVDGRVSVFRKSNDLRRKSLFPLSLIHVSDIHARFEETNLDTNVCKEFETCIGGYARTIAVVKRLLRTRSNPIYLNAGDTYTGTIWYSIDRWNVTSYFLNLLKADVMTIGNHEFDHGPEGLAPFLDAIESPLVLANADFSDEPSLQGKFHNSIILRRGGKRIGIFGLLIRNTVETSRTGKVKLLDEVETARKEAEKLKRHGIDIIIVLSHCGYNIDQKIARQVGSNIDVIVGSHTHTFLYTGKPPGRDIPENDYPTVITHNDGHKVLIVHSSAYTKYVGDLTVYFDDKGELIHWTGQPIYLSSDVPQDPQILEEMKPWREKYQRITNEKLIEIDFDLDANDCYSKECIMGDFLTDVFLNYYKNQSLAKKSTLKPSIAIVQGPYMRSTLTKGPIAYGDLVTVLPYGGNIVEFELSGKAIWDTIEFAADKWVKSQSKYVLQVSGIKIEINATQPFGKRITFLKVECDSCPHRNYQPIELNKIYGVVTTDYLAGGGDGFTMIAANKKNEKGSEHDVHIVAEYLRSIKKLNEVKRSDRIKFTK